MQSRVQAINIVTLTVTVSVDSFSAVLPIS